MYGHNLQGLTLEIAIGKSIMGRREYFLASLLDDLALMFSFWYIPISSILARPLIFILDK